MRVVWATLALSFAALAGAEEPLGPFKSCFDGGDPLGAASGPTVPLGEVEKARAAFASARGFRACISYISLAQDMQWGAFEYAAPDKRRWLMRRGKDRPEAPVSELEAVQVGTEAWLRRDGGWSRLEAGRTPQDAVGSGAWLPDPAEILQTFFGKDADLVRVDSATARSGGFDLWSKLRRDGIALHETLYVGAGDRRPYRVSSGGPGIEAYLQLEIRDYDAQVEIQPPR